MKKTALFLLLLSVFLVSNVLAEEKIGLVADLPDGSYQQLTKEEMEAIKAPMAPPKKEAWDITSVMRERAINNAIKIQPVLLKK